MKYYAFALYSVLYESLIWLGFGYVVFILGHSAWWLAFALFMSFSQLKPRHFGICDGSKEGQQ